MKAFVAIVVLELVVSCAALGHRESGSTSLPLQDRVGITATEVCDALRAGGLPLSYSVSDIPIDPWDAIYDPVPGLVSKAVTVMATNSADLSIEVFDSERARAAEQRRRTEDWERLRASREPSALPDLLAPAACGPILVRLVQVSSSTIASQQRTQVLQILEERFGPCGPGHL